MAREPYGERGGSRPNRVQLGKRSCRESGPGTRRWRVAQTVGRSAATGLCQRQRQGCGLPQWGRGSDSEPLNIRLFRRDRAVPRPSKQSSSPTEFSEDRLDLLVRRETSLRSGAQATINPGKLLRGRLVFSTRKARFGVERNLSKPILCRGWPSVDALEHRRQHLCLHAWHPTRSSSLESRSLLRVYRLAGDHVP